MTDAGWCSMFGTTETSRAVSYFKIPSRTQDGSFLDRMTEVIPAGRGMYDVQLLVVDREDRTKQCAIGEIGEIYVRAGGLAEGYLGDDLAELTRTKFVDNWFIEPRRWIEEDKKRVAQLKTSQPWRQYYKGPRDRLYRMLLRTPLAYLTGVLPLYTSSDSRQAVETSDAICLQATS